MSNQISAYRGANPYAFVCYAHADSEAILDDIRWLNEYGEYIWYDEGILPGAEWTDTLADAIKGSRLFIYYVSPRSIDSEYCRRELNYALSLGIPVLPVHVEQTFVEGGLALSLGHRQAIHRYNMDADRYRTKLAEAMADDPGQFHLPSPRPAKPRLAPAVIGAMVLTGLIGFILFQSLVTPEHDENTTDSGFGTLAVLPFVNTTGNSDLDYLGDGISDEVRDLLSNTSGLSVAARSSSVYFRNRSESALEVAARLGVSTVLEGQLRLDGKAVQLSIQLIDGDTGLVSWSSSFEDPQSTSPTVQRNIASEIIARLSGIPVEPQLVTVTRNATANELMLLARHYERRVREHPETDVSLLDEAIQLYSEAAESDPTSALAHSRLAGALIYKGNLAAAEAPIFRALTLNSELSEVQETLGRYYWARSLPGVGAAWQRAVELNPNNADALASYASHIVSIDPPKPELAETFFRRALALDPLSISRFGDLATFYANGGDVGEVRLLIAQAELVFEGVAVYELIAHLYELIGDIDFAIAWGIRARDAQPENPVHRWRLAQLYATLLDYETALELEPEPGLGLLFRMRRYNELIDLGEWLMFEEPNDINIRYLMGFAYHALDRNEEALTVLSAAGIPERLYGETRRTADREAFVTYLGALNAERDGVRVAEMWGKVFFLGRVGNRDWWPFIYASCIELLAGKDDQALKRLAESTVSERIPWNPILRDYPCFRKVHDHPVYQQVVKHYDEKRKSQRQRLPKTLNEMGVSL